MQNFVSLNSLKELLREPDGSELSVQQAVDRYGRQVVGIAALNDCVRNHMRKRRLHGYPPSIFISYKWQDDEHKQWVKRACDAFRDTGYDVLLDQYDCFVKDHLDVPAYVGRMAECHYIVMVVTSDYLEKGTYVFDEINIAAHLSVQGLSRNIALVRDLPEGVSHDDLNRRLCCDPGDLHFVESISDPYSFIVRTFPHARLRYTAEQQQRLLSLADEGEALIDDGKCRAAAELINGNPDLAESIEVETLIALIYAKASSDKQKALNIARRLLASNAPDSRARPRLSEVLRDCGHYREALQALSSVRGSDRWAMLATYFRGILLDDLAAYPTARRHLEYHRARLGDQPLILNDLGFVCKNGGDLAEAERCYRRALALRPDYPNALANLAALLRNDGRTAEAESIVVRAKAKIPNFAESVAQLCSAVVPACCESAKPGGIGFTCDHCHTLFRANPDAENMCMDCGVVYVAAARCCPCCACTNFVALSVLPIDPDDEIAVYCPICRIGELSRSADGRAPPGGGGSDDSE
jgi:tetratricopeptide (TPR) repeat protein